MRFLGLDQVPLRETNHYLTNQPIPSLLGQAPNRIDITGRNCSLSVDIGLYYDFMLRTYNKGVYKITEAGTSIPS